MASPQKEHGYTAIANELAEAFMRLNLSPHEWRVLFCVIRYSYGWNRKTARLTCSRFSALTGIDIRLIPRIVRRLADKKVVVRDRNTFSLQKDYSLWRPAARMSSAQMIHIISRDDAPSSAQMTGTPDFHSGSRRLPHSKDIVKDSIKKSLYRERLLKRLKALFPDAKIPGHVANRQIDYFLFRAEGGLDYRRVQDPVRYIRSLIINEDFPPLPAREEKAEEEKRQGLEKLRKAREEREAFRKENHGEIQQEIKAFVSKIAGRGMK